MVLTRSWRFTAAMSGGLWNRAPVKHSRACREQHKTLRISLRRPEDVHTVRVCVQWCPLFFDETRPSKPARSSCPAAAEEHCSGEQETRERGGPETLREWIKHAHHHTHTTANRWKTVESFNKLWFFHLIHISGLKEQSKWIVVINIMGPSDVDWVKNIPSQFCTFTSTWYNIFLK